MVSSIKNISEISNSFVLVWLVEVDSLRYFYALLLLALYTTTMFVSSMIVYLSWTEESLHEPMYIFICALNVNVMFTCSSLHPKLLIDLLSKCSTISLAGCLSQSFFIQTPVSIEMHIFTVMAYDRYLAVGHPLRYPTLMTNLTSVKLLSAIWVAAIIPMIGTILLTARLTFCSEIIDNFFCETFSLQRLACDDTSVNVIYGSFITLFYVFGSVLVIVYSYIRTALICLKLSAEAFQKATQTLVTHIMAFSTFMVSLMFFAFRYRLSIGSFSTAAQVVIVVTGAFTSTTLNPLIYGIRTQVLRVKIVHTLKKLTEVK